MRVARPLLPLILDFYTVLTGSTKVATPWFPALEAAVKEVIGKLPSGSGTFASNIRESQLLKNYGGSYDSNATITRRMLYLLEGEYLINEAEFLRVRSQIIER